jgi:cellulose synthase/poly-beta-1,6-N-acetylglucosamine synthase-like glycosyltransferase
MPEFWHYFIARLTPATLGGSLGSALTHMYGPAFFFILAITTINQLPPLIMWFVFMARPRAFDPPANPGFRPLVSVIVPGRNLGKNIATTIDSVLQAGYENIEIIYADDNSTDDSASWARTFESTGKVKVFASEKHHGKPVTINIALAFAQGELIFVLDGDSDIEPGTIDALVAYFQDERVGAAVTNLLIKGHSLLTYLISMEFSLTGTLGRIWRAPFDILRMLPGPSTMFRATALRSIGCFDPGLGDDTDITLRLRKAGWHLRYVSTHCVRTDCPSNLRGLLKQRNRWARGMMKVRFNKHFDFGHPRYGGNSTLLWCEFVVQTIMSLRGLQTILFFVFATIFVRSDIVIPIYGLNVLFILIKALIANDLTGYPRFRHFWLVILYPAYLLPIRLAVECGIVRELLRIKPYHPYVPKRIWEQTPYH